MSPKDIKVDANKFQAEVVEAVNGKYSQLFLWDFPILPRQGESIHVAFNLKPKYRGWYKVKEVVWKPILYVDEELGAAWRLYSDPAAFVVVEKL